MSSCQDSMDTEDSIPRPEYEDIVPSEEDVDEDEDDIESWIQKAKTKTSPIENGTERQEAASSQLTVISNIAPSVAITNSNQIVLNSDKNAMEVDDENEEISYDEADEEEDDEDDVDNDIGKNIVNIVNRTVTQSSQKKDDPLKILDCVKPVATDASITTAGVTVPAGPHTDSRYNKLVLVTLINENGKVMLPVTAKPVIGNTMNKRSPAVTPEEEKPSLMDEVKSSPLIATKEDQPRSSTPSGKGTREFLALQRAFTESKVLSEFVTEKDRSRKSRKLPLKSDDSTTGDSSEKEKFRICRARSKSCTRTPVRLVTMLNSSAPQRWPSDEKLNSKRENMRSQNTDFVQKQMKFLNRVNHDQVGDDPLSDASDGEQSLNESNKTVGSVENKDDYWQPPPKRGSDSFCWKCRKCADLIACSKCPRSYHYKCIKVGTTTKLDRTWICPECVGLENCINGPKKTKKEALSVDMLNQLLLFALKRMQQIKGHEKLLDVPDESECPLYARYVVNPVTLNSIQGKIEKKVFKCTEEFVLETKWIQHNVSIAYAACSSKYLLIAKNILKVCRQEAAEIETCPECYLNANTSKDWFVDVCLKPHILLWAKLKGFPYWPAKGMGLGPNSLVNVRFFGDHDRAFVPVKDCFLYSEADPNPPSGKRAFRPGIADCIKEVAVHIQKIKAKVGSFNFAQVRTQYDPNNETTQLEEMMPGVTEYVKRQQAVQKPPLTYKIVKTAGNSLSYIRKPDSGTDSDHSSLSGTEKNQKVTTRNSTEISKPSALSETAKKAAKESQTVTQSTPPPKSITTPTTAVNTTTLNSKTAPIKAVSLNYEVVAKPVNKDENSSSKITSMILKRKSDVVLLSPSVKKSKSSEDSSIKEYPDIDLSSPKEEEELEESKEPLEPVPAKRTRSSHSGEKISVVQALLPPAFVVIRTGPSELQKLQPQQQSLQKPQQPPAPAPEPEPQQHQKPQQQPQKSQQQQQQQQQQQKPQQSPSPPQKPQPQPQRPQPQAQKPQQLQKPDVATTSSPNKTAAETSNAMVRLVQNRQGVTIKKIPKKQSGITTYFTAMEDKQPKNAAHEKLKCVVERYSQTKLPPITSKAIPLPAPPPKPVVSPPKPVPSPPKSVSISLGAKSNASYPCTRIQLSPKPTPSPPATEKAKSSKGLIPFEDIKLERPDDEELLLAKSIQSTSRAVDPLATPSTSSTPNSTLSHSSASNGNPKGPHSSAANTSLLSVNPDLVKKEMIDDDDSLQSIPSQDNASPAVAVNPPTSRPSEPPRLIGETMIQRIVVRSLESLTMQPPPLKSAPPFYLTSRATSFQSPSPPVTTSPTQSKTPNPRARKSFPNKGPNPTTVVLPPDVKRSLTKNSMVYIPGDSQSNTVPIQPLTAVSKPVNHNHAMPKVTCTVSIPTTSSSQNTCSPATTKSPIILPTSTAIPLPAPPQPPTATITVSASLTNSTNSVTSMVTAVTSSLSYRPGYVSSLKTLSPLQLSVPAATPTTEAEETNEINRAVEGHILSGIVTPSLAAAITDTIVRGPPRLAPRPNGALRSDGNYGFNSDAGPVCRTLVENAHKMTDFFISVMQDTVSDMADAGILQAKVVELEMELETKTSSYEKQLYELKQNTDTMLCEMKKSIEAERIRIVSETRKQCEIERIHAVEQTKKRQWCKNCGREANSYCCWNTAYCDSTCQTLDWSRHKTTCCQILNPHLNADLQGPGILYSAPTFNPASSTITTPTHNQTNNYTTPGFMTLQPNQTPHPIQAVPPFQPIQPIYRYRPNQVTPTQPSSSATLASQQTSTTNTIPGVYPPSTTMPVIPTTKEVLKLPSSTYLRALPPTIRLNPAPQVHRFNIPLPLASASTTGGPPYTLVHRAGSWELLSSTQPSTTAGTPTASLQQPPRLIATVPANLPQDSRTSGPAMVRSSHI